MSDTLERVEIDHEAAITWGRRNGVPLEQLDVAAVNAKRAEHGLPAFRIVPPRSLKLYRIPDPKWGA